MVKNDESVPDPATYQYYWTKESSMTLLEFLSKYKPSMVQDDGTKPWIWVQGAERPKSEADEEAATTEALALLQEVTQKVESIKNDDSIPLRSSKKTGAKSKKEIREQVQAEATEKLKEISIRHKYVVGKWLIFAPPEKVDMVWLALSQSLAGGPLSATGAYVAKVATSPRAETPGYQHVLCLYVPDVYDRAAVTKVMKVLLRDHGMNLSGVKSDLYTVIGLDSKHPSGIPSTIWKNTALMKDTEIKELKETYFSALKTDTSRPTAAVPAPDPTTASTGAAAGASASVEAVAAGAKNEGSTAGGANAPISKAEEAGKVGAVKVGAGRGKKLLRKRRVEEDDPFASDDEDVVTKPAVKPTSKGASKPASKATASKPVSREGEKKPGAKKAPAKKRKLDEEDFVSADEEEAEEKGAAKKRGRR